MRLYLCLYLCWCLYLCRYRCLYLWTQGAEGKELLRAVYRKAQETARNQLQGAGMIVNADDADPLLLCLDGKPSGIKPKP